MKLKPVTLPNHPQAKTLVVQEPLKPFRSVVTERSYRYLQEVHNVKADHAAALVGRNV